MHAADGTPLANAPRASRKDLRDAVRAARKAFPDWADRTAMNRGQILYRVAELMEGRREQFADEVGARRGPRRPRPRGRSSTARSTAGSGTPAGPTRSRQVLGTVNPVAAPYFNFTIPEPSGVVGVVAPEASSLLGLVSRLAPVVVPGNTAVVVTSETRPLPAVTLVGGPGHVRRAGRRHQRPHRPASASWCPVLAAHADVDGLDVWGVPDDLRTGVEEAAAESVKRLARPTRDLVDRRVRLDQRPPRRSGPSGSPPSSR